MFVLLSSTIINLTTIRQVLDYTGIQIIVTEKSSGRPYVNQNISPELQEFCKHNSSMYQCNKF